MSGNETLDLDSIERRFQDVVARDEWRAVERAVAAAGTLLIFGNGGNLAVAQHAAADLARLTDKRTAAPRSAVEVSALANDFGFDGWLERWLRDELRGGEGEGRRDRSDAVAVGLSCSGVSAGVMRALEAAADVGASPVLLSAVPPADRPCGLTVVLGARYYHSAEVLMSLLAYQLAVACGARPRGLG